MSIERIAAIIAAAISPAQTLTDSIMAICNWLYWTFCPGAGSDAASHLWWAVVHGQEFAGAIWPGEWTVVADALLALIP